MDPVPGHSLQSKGEIIASWTSYHEKGSALPGELLQVLQETDSIPSDSTSDQILGDTKDYWL